MTGGKPMQDSIRAACALIGVIVVTDPVLAEAEADGYLQDFVRGDFEKITEFLHEQNCDDSVRHGAVVFVALSACNSYSHDYFLKVANCIRMLDGLIENMRYHASDSDIFREYTIGAFESVAVFQKMAPKSEISRYAEMLAAIGNSRHTRPLRSTIRQIRADLLKKEAA